LIGFEPSPYFVGSSPAPGAFEEKNLLLAFQLLAILFARESKASKIL
jgi:hypothetical protein